MKKEALKTIILLMCMIIGAFSIGNSYACTDVMMKTNGDYRISGRTMDFSYPLGSKLIVVPRRQSYQSTVPSGKKGLEWTSKYGFVGLNIQDQPNLSDGMNEKGLSAGLLWLLGTEYPKTQTDSKALAIEDSVRWILGNFATIAELKKGLQQVEIWGHYIEAMHVMPPIHITAHDASGNSLVVEFLGGEMKVYDNINGVLTNQPDFEYQTTNLQYRKWKLGLARSAVSVPGEWYPTERFIRTSIVREALPAPKSLAEAVAQGVRVLNSVQVPYGTPGTDSEGGKKGDCDHTLWSLIRDHQNLVLYYRSMNNQSLQAIDLKSLDFSGDKSYEPISVNSGKWHIPVSVKVR